MNSTNTTLCLLAELSVDDGRQCAARRRTARAANAQARHGTPEQRRAEADDAQEFHQIQKFVAACRRQWPGAMIVLRPDGAPIGASPPSDLNPAPGGITDE